MVKIQLRTFTLSMYSQRAFNRARRPMAMTADIPLMLAPPGEQTEHVCKLHGVATTPAGGGGPGQYGYTHVWQLRGAPDVAAAVGEYQATTTMPLPPPPPPPAVADDTATAARQRDAAARTLSRPRGDHLYDCPLFDDRLLARLQTGSHIHSPGCRRHQVNSSSHDGAYCELGWARERNSHSRSPISSDLDLWPFGSKTIITEYLKIVICTKFGGPGLFIYLLFVRNHNETITCKQAWGRTVRLIGL